MPKTVSQLFPKLQEVIAEQLGLDASNIKPEDRLHEDLGADSLDSTELAMAIEEDFGVEIPDEQNEKFVTVQDILEYLEANAE